MKYLWLWFSKSDWSRDSKYLGDKSMVYRHPLWKICFFNDPVLTYQDSSEKFFMFIDQVLQCPSTLHLYTVVIFNNMFWDLQNLLL